MELAENDLNNSTSPLVANSPDLPRLAGLSSEVKSGGRLDKFGNVIQKRALVLA